MSHQIAKGTTTFRYGFQSETQLLTFLLENKNIAGLAFIGRSNVGKSSLINALFGKKTARTSKTPGRTREINVFSFRLESEGKIDETLPEFFLFDLPGYGFAQVDDKMSQNWNLLMTTFFKHASKNIALCNLQDARHPMQKADLDYKDFILPFEFESILILNKIDKLKTQKDRAALKKVLPKIKAEFKHAISTHSTSAEGLQGVPELESDVTEYLKSKVAAE